MSYISVIGAGSWGTTLACLLTTKGYDITLWAHEKELAEEMSTSRINSIYLPGISLPDEMHVTHSLEKSLQKARYVINAVPSQYTRLVFQGDKSRKIRFYVFFSAYASLGQGVMASQQYVFWEDHL